MVSSRNLSKKRITTQNISLSPYLKDWIERYVKKKHLEQPKDKRFKSISSFFNYSMESLMKFFEKEKTLDDLEKIVDEEINSFYEQFTFKALAPIYNELVEMNKFNFENIKPIFLMMQMFHKFVKNKSEFNFYELKSIAERIETFMKGNKLTQRLNFEIINENLIIEYIGFQYANIHHEHTKTIIILASTIGLELTDVSYAKNEIYSKLTFKKTKLFTTKNSKQRDIKELLNRNMSFFLNYYRMMNDHSRFFWSNLSNNKELVITIKNKTYALEFLTHIINEIRKHAPENELKACILKLFEQLHWISLKDEFLLAFEMNLNENNIVEKDIIVDILNSYGNLEKKESIFYLK